MAASQIAIITAKKKTTPPLDQFIVTSVQFLTEFSELHELPGWLKKCPDWQGGVARRPAANSLDLTNQLNPERTLPK
jgi:hypothetical protein